jgi:hypothetical protein
MISMELEAGEGKKGRRKGDGAVGFITKLGAAKQALALAEDIPDISELLDNAEAIREAAKAKHISAPGVNAWTRFVVDIERKGWARIAAMQKSGELPAKAGRPKKNPDGRGITLNDLVPDQRASEWSMLARLTDQQLDEMERLANAEDRLLTHSELLRLAKGGMPTPSKADGAAKMRTVEDQTLIAKARLIATDKGFAGNDIQIDDDAEINKEDRGAWIQAWIFLEDELIRSDLQD